MPPKNEETMDEHTVKIIVAEVLAEQRRSMDTDEVMLKTVASILKSFGIDEDERLEIKADFSHLRRWRKSVEQAQSYTFKAIITVIVSGFIGAVWLGVKAMIGK